ncbi:SLATT domain-containing protein [Cecembia rubra]|uniref:SMODS and SLOG-associating 2TM effector domain-containing protein n=1 Tax=Cecembia rubra TaxID=1485585 RepID=A0A2P8DM76_9BACT|nr:SLATT domain-containing protein [Cecembia rubra]PSK98314.1 hypothetical protein CLV48_11913 [Cecembia rubra]
MEKAKSYLDYLDKTYLEELNYKIWSTKGARFNASHRLLKISQLSNLCTSLFSVYLIAVGLLSVYNIYNSSFISGNILAYSTTCLSILLLVFTQTENSKDYSKKANEFHNCALELSELYNRLRIFKTLNENNTLENKRIFAEEISEEYGRILQRHENHDPIDHEIFKAKKAKYHQLKWTNITTIKLKYYFETKFIFRALIGFPPLIIVLIVGGS